MGFGGARVLNLVESPQVRPTYERLLATAAAGDIRVKVQLFPAPPKQSHRRYTFEMWKTTGFIKSARVAYFHVDELGDRNVADGPKITLSASVLHHK